MEEKGGSSGDGVCKVFVESLKEGSDPVVWIVVVSNAESGECSTVVTLVVKCRLL